jgi:hypothetical protein
MEPHLSGLLPRQPRSVEYVILKASSPKWHAHSGVGGFFNMHRGFSSKLVKAAEIDSWPGQQTIVNGEVVGIYLFRCDERKESTLSG